MELDLARAAVETVVRQLATVTKTNQVPAQGFQHLQGLCQTLLRLAATPLAWE